MTKGVMWAPEATIAFFDEEAAPQDMPSRNRQPSAQSAAASSRLEGLRPIAIREPSVPKEDADRMEGTFESWSSASSTELGAVLNEIVKADALPRKVKLTRASFIASRLTAEKKGPNSFVDDDNNTPLHLASSLGLTELVRVLAPDPEQSLLPNRHGETPLALAAARGDAQTVQVMLDNRLDAKEVDELDAELRQKLWFGALTSDNAALAERLTGKVSDFSAVDEYGNTALHQAAAGEMVEVLRQLAGKVGTDAVNKYGHTALICAAQFGSVKALARLLKQGADVRWRDNNKRTALYHAAKAGHCDVVDVLLDAHADVDWSILSTAASEGRAQVLRLFADRGIDIHQIDERGDTLLTLAAKHGHSDVIDVMLAHGAAIDAADGEGVTPLAHAAMNDRVDVARTLLEFGAQVDVPDGVGRTPLLLAASKNHAEITELLLAKNADPNQVSPQGLTPLLAATWQNGVEAIRVLLEHGANPSQGNRTGKTAQQIAQQRSGDQQADEIFEILRNAPIARRGRQAS